MATDFSSNSVERFAPTRVFRSNARFYAPAHVVELLGDIASVEHLALVVDVDALEGSAFAKVERVMVLALDALTYAKVQVVLVSRHQPDRAAILHRGIPRSWCLDDVAALAQVRARIPDVRLIVISDNRGLLESLGDRDRGIALGTDDVFARANIATTGDISIRAALWWLVDARSRASGKVAQP